MTYFPQVARPARNRRSIHDEDMDWDADLERALLDTLRTGMAVQLPLWQFHSSPAKGRLWKKGWKVAHRVLSDRQTVAAWVAGERAGLNEIDG